MKSPSLGKVKEERKSFRYFIRSSCFVTIQKLFLNYQNSPILTYLKPQLPENRYRFDLPYSKLHWLNSQYRIKVDQVLTYNGGGGSE